MSGLAAPEKFAELERLWFRDRDDLALVAALEYCRHHRLLPPDWLFDEIARLAADGIPDQAWRNFKANAEDLEMVAAVKCADGENKLVHDGRVMELVGDELRGDVYERASCLLRKCGVHKTADAVKKARERFQRGMRDPSGPHRHAVALSPWLLRWRAALHR